jgi:hypothetical protein
MGIVSGRKWRFCKSGWFAVMPLFNGCLVAFASQLVTTDIGNRFILAILASALLYCSSGNEIAVPKATVCSYQWP